MTSTTLDLAAKVHGSAVLQRWLAGRPGAAERAGLSAQPQAHAGHVPWGGISWDDWVRGNVAGLAGVNEQAARALAAVNACVNLIGGSIASMPLHLYRRRSDGEREAVKPPLWWLLNERPAPGWSAASFWEFLVASRLFHGDAFARIVRRGAQAAGFEPYHPRHVRVRRIEGTLVYDLRQDDGSEISVQQHDMLHVAGPGFDGFRSLSQLQYGLRHAAGIALAADETAAGFFEDGVRADFAIEVPGNMDREQQETLRRTFMDRHAGRTASRAPIVLAGGIKLHQLTMSSEDAELLSTRGFQIEEVCRVFGVPPFMIGHTEKTSSWGSGIEQMSLGFVKYTLQRHLVAIEQELNHKLFTTSRNFAEFLTAGLERGDLKGRFEAYRIALGRAGEPAWMRPSEVRRLENLPPDAELDDAEPAAADSAAPLPPIDAPAEDATT